MDYTTLQTFMDHLKWADDGSEAAIAGQRLYDDVLAQSGLEPVFIDGKVCLYAKYHSEEEMVEDVYAKDQAHSTTRTATTRKGHLGFGCRQGRVRPPRRAARKVVWKPRRAARRDARREVRRQGHTP